MGDKRRLSYKWKKQNRSHWLLLGFSAALSLFVLLKLLNTQQTQELVSLQKLQTKECPKPCLDALIPYHEADQSMFVHNGALFAAKKHLKGVRYFFVVSVSNKTFEHMLDEQVRWYDETEIPFYDQLHEGKISGWKYQQALKMWAAQNIPGLCNNVLILDADVLWIRDFDVIAPTLADSDGRCPAAKFKYNIATAASGAWESDIYSGAYHSFVEYFTGLPKMDADSLTAISHWQVVQRDVLEALNKSLAARTRKSIENAMLQYGGQQQYDMTEYEAYYSFISYFYPDRAATILLPYVIRQPKLCNYSDASTIGPFLNSEIAYFTCHDRYDREDFYVNCNGRKCRTVL
jgi:hypothetical protein